MHFEKNTVYHIYNQGNNRQNIFFLDKNYLFFLKKMRTHLLPHGDFLCYCLMPNHFHWLFYVRHNQIPHVETSGNGTVKYRSLNDSIGILLRSYTRAINKQENRTGALFREKTKAKDGTETLVDQVTKFNYAQSWSDWATYGHVAFNYIHQNPVKAGLVDNAIEWPFSSAADYAGIRSGTLCNQQLARTLIPSLFSL